MSVAGDVEGWPYSSGRLFLFSVRERDQDREREHDQHYGDHDKVRNRKADEVPRDHVRRVVEIED